MSRGLFGKQTIQQKQKNKMTNTVRDYNTAEVIGTATPSLVSASIEAGPTGAVCAYQSSAFHGMVVWDVIPSSQRDHFRREGYDVRTVYVD